MEVTWCWDLQAGSIIDCCSVKMHYVVYSSFDPLSGGVSHCSASLWILTLKLLPCGNLIGWGAWIEAQGHKHKVPMFLYTQRFSLLIEC